VPLDERREGVAVSSQDESCELLIRCLRDNRGNLRC
jgi:hypothetical protein